MARREKIRERVEEYIRTSSEIRTAGTELAGLDLQYDGLYREIRQRTMEIRHLEDKQSETRSLLYKDRAKEYVEDVIHFLGEKMEEYDGKAGYRHLFVAVKFWYEYYDEFVSKKLEDMTPEQMAIYKEEFE